MVKTVMAILAAAGWCAAQDLPRHGMIGLAVADTPPVVKTAIEGGAGAAAGIEAGDVIRKLDGASVGTPDEFVRAVGRHLGGDSVAVEIARGSEILTKAVVLKPRPLETSPFADVIYGSVEVRGARRRSIVTRPKREGRMPAVFFMGGLGCYSMDSAGRETGYGRVIGELEKRGFVTMRVDKTGEGDSEGPPCRDPSATVDLEAEGYVAGLRALKKYDFVDPSKVFVFAHSMGPVVGSLAIAQEPVRGFMAIETIGTSWYEYDVERSRVQADLGSLSPEQVDAEVRAEETCSHALYVEKLKPAQILAKPGCENTFQPFGGAPYTYMQGVADISLGKNWKSADFPVLVVYGTASPVTTARQSHYLADLINRLHPGRATYVEIPGMGHDLNRYESQREYMNRTPGGEHPFHTGLIDAMVSWMEKVLA